MIGDLISIQHTEGVGYYHHVHSFVRGNWRRADETSPMILAKCCHDMDILLWLVKSKCKSISSCGSLIHFRKENMPEGAPIRCTDGCIHSAECPYYAPRLYIGDEAPGALFRRTVAMEETDEAVMQQLREGPYGRCTYRCDNDVVDNQVVSMMFENGVSVSLTMSAFTEKCERVINIMCSKGQILGNMETGVIEIKEFMGGIHRTIELNTPSAGHSGSDERMIRDFVGLISSGKNISLSNARVSVDSHLMALAAEESRINGQTIIMKEYGR